RRSPPHPPPRPSLRPLSLHHRLPISRPARGRSAAVRPYMGGSVPPLRPQAPPPALTPALVDQSRRWKFPARGLTRRSFTAGTWGERARPPPPNPPTGSPFGAWRPV